MAATAQFRVRLRSDSHGRRHAKHVRVLRDLTDGDVTVVDECPTARQRARADVPGIRTVRCVEEVTNDVDAFVIATPPGSHTRLALQVLAAGRHVLVEKPMTTSVEEAQRLIHAAERNHALLMVGHTFRYHSAVWELKKILRSGALGRLVRVDTARLAPGRRQQDVDVIWDLAVHDVSILTYLLDEHPSRVTAHAEHQAGRRQHERSRICLQFDRHGVHAHVSVSWVHPKKVRTIMLTGEQGVAVLDDVRSSNTIEVFGRPPMGVAVRSPVGDEEAQVPTGPSVSHLVSLEEPLRVQDRHFIECVLSGSKPTTDATDGLRAVQVLAAVQTSLRDCSPAAVLT